MTGLFARRKGRHCRHGSFTGWSALAPVASLKPVVEESFSRPRTAPRGLVPYPMAADLYPYNPLKDAS
jgi:hypothetical protein